MFEAGLSRPGKSGEGFGTGPKVNVSSDPEGPGTKNFQDIATTLPTPRSWLLSVAF